MTSDYLNSSRIEPRTGKITRATTSTPSSGVTPTQTTVSAESLTEAQNVNCGLPWYLKFEDGTLTVLVNLHVDGKGTINRTPIEANEFATVQYVNDMLQDITGVDMSAYLLRAGGTMTGYLTLVGPPTAALHAANRDWVNTQINSAVSAIQAGATNLNALTDVTLTSPTSGQILSYNGSQWVNAAGSSGGAVNLAGLSDVTISSVASGQILSYNGTRWVNQTFTAGVTTLSALNDVTVSSPTNGQFLSFNGTRWVNVAAPTGSGGATALSGLTDVIISSVASGQILKHNGTRWANAVHNLDGLSDVVITSPTTGQTISYNGTSWVNGTASSGGASAFTALSDTPNTIQASKVVAGNSGGTALEFVLGNVVQCFTFNVVFTGTNPSSFTGVPSGWTITTPSAGVIQINHGLNRQPIHVFAWGLTTTANTWTQRSVGGAALNMTYADTAMSVTYINGFTTTNTAATGLLARVTVYFTL